MRAAPEGGGDFSGGDFSPGATHDTRTLGTNITWPEGEKNQKVPMWMFLEYMDLGNAFPTAKWGAGSILPS